MFASAGGADACNELEAVIRNPNARSEGAETATDNAVSALMKIIEFQAGAVGPEKIVSLVQLVLEYLPAKADESEARVMHGALIRMVQASDGRYLGENLVNLGPIIRIFCEVLAKRTVDEEYTNLAVQCLKSMQSQLPQDVLARAASVLTDEQRQTLSAALNS